jgi:hypothetical protein
VSCRDRSAARTVHGVGARGRMVGMGVLFINQSGPHTRSFNQPRTEQGKQNTHHTLPLPHPSATSSS